MMMAKLARNLFVAAVAMVGTASAVSIELGPLSANGSGGGSIPGAGSVAVSTVPNGVQIGRDVDQT